MHDRDLEPGATAQRSTESDVTRRNVLLGSTAALMATVLPLGASAEFSHASRVPQSRLETPR
jgi:hypothetical protein